jgi:Holliday junction DNA helicase RuvA
MISTLRGIPHISLDRKSVVIETSGGVGYLVFVTPQCASTMQDGKEVVVFTFLRVAEGVMDLYGFESLEAKSLFERLISVSGVGPKTALGVLASGSLSSLEDALSRGDVSYLTSVQGIGKKTAERLVVELKGKMVSGIQVFGAQPLQEAAEALISMGYTLGDVQKIMQTVPGDCVQTEQVIKYALRQLQ